MSTRAGFHSGEAHAKRVRSDDQYIDERQLIRARDFETTYMGSGVAATADERAHLINSYKFYGGPGGPTMSGVSFEFVAPSSLKSDVKCDVTLVWIPGTAVAGNVTWALDYWAFGYLNFSGVVTGTKNWVVSGSLVDGRIKVTTTAQTHPAEISGVIQHTVLSIPSSDIRANDIVEAKIYRAGLEASDTLSGTVHLLGALVGYR